MRRILKLLILLFIPVSLFGQIDITKRNISVDTMKSRQGTYITFRDPIVLERRNSYPSTIGLPIGYMACIKDTIMSWTGLYWFKMINSVLVSNGLSKSGDTVQLGGNLTKATNINIGNSGSMTIGRDDANKALSLGIHTIYGNNYIGMFAQDKNVGNRYSQVTVQGDYIRFAAQGGTTTTVFVDSMGMSYSNDISSRYQSRTIVDSAFVGKALRNLDMSSYQKKSDTTTYDATRTWVRLAINDTADALRSEWRSDIHDSIDNIPPVLASNGLTKDGDTVELGGGMTGNTTINGNNKDLIFGTNASPLSDFGLAIDDGSGGKNSISYSGNNLYIDALSNDLAFSSEINQSPNAIYIYVQDNNESDQNSLELNTNGSIIIKNEIGTNGISYAQDYSANYGSRTLVDSAFVGKAIGQVNVDTVKFAHNTDSAKGNFVVVGKVNMGDYTNASPDTGDLWRDGSALYFRCENYVRDLNFASNTVGTLSKVRIYNNYNGTVNASSVPVYLYSVANWTGDYKRYIIDSTANIPLTNNSINYLYADYNSGSPIYAVTTNPADINSSNKILVATISRESNDIHWIPVEWGLATAVKSNNKDVNLHRFERSSGVNLTDSTGLRFKLSSGALWYGNTSYAKEAKYGLDTSFFYYHVAGNWTKSKVVTYPNTQYDDGTALQTLSNNNKYAVIWIFRYINGDNLPKTAFVLGTGDYTLDQALSSSVPSVPAYLDRVAILTGRIIVQKGLSTPYLVQSAFTQSFAGTLISNHNDLSGLQGGSPYYHLSQSKYDSLNYMVVEGDSVSLFATKKNLRDTALSLTDKINLRQRYSDTITIDATKKNLRDTAVSLTAKINLKKNDISSITKEETGFAYPDSVIMTYDTTTRKVTLTGNPRAYWRGQLITALVSGWVSDAHATGDGQFYLKYNGSSFTWTNSLWDFSELQIAFVKKNGSNHLIAINENHGLMPWQSHLSNHLNIGTFLISGGDISNVILNSTTPANRRPYISETKVRDEDAPNTLPVLNTNSYSWLYLTGSGISVIKTDSADIVNKLGNNPYYNQFTGGAWQQTLMPNNAYQKIFVMALPVSQGVISQKRRFLFVQGQTQSTSLSTIQAIRPASINFGDLSSSLAEYVFIDEIIIRYTAANWQIVEVNKLTGNRSFQVSSPAGNYLSIVSTDNNFTGTGTASDPLTLNLKTGNGISESGDTVQLGGSLTKNTTINTNGFKLITSGTDTIKFNNNHVQSRHILVGESNGNSQAGYGELDFVSQTIGGGGLSTYGLAGGGGEYVAMNIRRGNGTFDNPTSMTAYGEMSYINFDGRTSDGGWKSGAQIQTRNMGSLTNADFGTEFEIKTINPGSGSLSSKIYINPNIIFNNENLDLDFIIKKNTSDTSFIYDAGLDKIRLKSDLRFTGSTSGYTGFKAAATSTPVTYTLPSADGTNGQVLKTNGSGTLSWTSVADVDSVRTITQGTTTNIIIADTTTYRFAIVEYQVTRGTQYQGGTAKLLFKGGTNTTYDNTYIGDNVGLTISSDQSGGNLRLVAVLTSGADATIKYKVRKIIK